MKLGTQRRAHAFTLVELFISIAVIVIVAAVLLPALTPGPRRSKKINCTNNLKQIGLAFRTWELDYNDRFPLHVAVTNGGLMELVTNGLAYLHFQIMSNELSTPKILVCPSDAGRTLATNFTSDFKNQKLSYFVGLDVVESNDVTFLSGDRNIANGSQLSNHVLTLNTNVPSVWTPAIHVGQGNIAFADGSVEGLSSQRLQAALVATGIATNRLAMP
jgi:prepilin-type processing-associated H-X9-DG protein